MRIWFREWKEAHLIRDYVVEDNSDRNRTKKIFDAVDIVCREFDLSRPVWLETTIKDFKKSAAARFTQDNFVEEVDFDYIEISVLEED